MPFPTLSDVKPRPIEWIWEGVLARGMFTLLQGDPGAGKGFIATDVAARVTRGLPMPSAQAALSAPSNVLLCSTEEMRSFIQRPRAEAAGADLQRVFPMQELDPFGRSPAQILEATVKMIEEQVRADSILLVIVDPITGFLPDLPINDAMSVRRAMTALARMAEGTGCAILAIHHLSKRLGRSALYRGGGSIAFAAVSRFVYAVGADPADTGVRVLACVKNNICARPLSLSFRIAPCAVGGIPSARVEWLGPSSLSADEIASPAPVRRKPTAIEKAQDFLCELLAAGPVRETEIRRKAARRQLTFATLRRAKKDAGICSVRDGKTGCWSWALEEHVRTERVSASQMSTLLDSSQNDPKSADSTLETAANATIARSSSARRRLDN